MLRLKQKDVSINPVNIESVTIIGKGVVIGMVSETGSIFVELETVEDAISFAAYVELLVNISNTGRTEIQNEMVQIFESYFEHKDVLRPHAQYREYKRLEKLLTERNRKS